MRKVWRNRLIWSLAGCVQLATHAANSQNSTDWSPASQQLNSSELAKQLVVVTEHTDLTDSVYASVLRGLAFLPESMKRFFIDRGVKVKIVPSNKDGKSEYGPKEKQVIIIERNNDGSTVDLKRLDITTLHELGHAYDQQLAYPSRTPAFQAIYQKEAPAVRPEYRQVLAHFLKPGNFGPGECFASLFACRYYPGNDRRLTWLKESFPETFAYSRTLHE